MNGSGSALPKSRVVSLAIARSVLPVKARLMTVSLSLIARIASLYACPACASTLAMKRVPIHTPGAAEGQRRRKARARRTSAAGGDHRHVDRVDDLRP